MRCLLLTLLMLWALPASAEDRWPQFRGPDGQGRSAETGLPDSWSETEHVRWKTAIAGKGWSSPVVWDGKVWLTTAVEQQLSAEEFDARLADNKFKKNLALAAGISLRAVCVELATGRIVQDVGLFQIDEPEPIHKLNSYASPTPLIEEGRLYCHFGTYGTACVNTSTGTVLWQRRIELKHNVGPGSSPVMHGNVIILTCDGSDRQFVTALDKRDGSTLWTTPRPPMEGDDGDHHKAYSTPLVVSAPGGPQVVIPGAQWFVAYEPETGQPIWQINHGKGFSNVPRPVAGHGRVYLCTGFVRHQLWAVRLDGRGDVTDSHVAWTRDQGIPDKPSPMLVGDAIYLVSGNGIASCLDAETGELRWRERLGGNYSASPLLADGRIYFCSHEGKTTVIRPGDAYQELAVNELDGQLMASPVAVDHSLLMRSDTHLYRIADRSLAAGK